MAPLSSVMVIGTGLPQKKIKMEIVIIVCVLLVIVTLRLLRNKYKWVDKVTAGFCLGAPIVVWILYNFWIALLSFIVLLGVAFLVFGRDKKVTIGGREYEIECSKCNYNHTEIVSRTVEENDDVKIKYHCPRCGHNGSWIFSK